MKTPVIPYLAATIALALAGCGSDPDAAGPAMTDGEATQATASPAPATPSAAAEARGEGGGPTIADLGLKPGVYNRGSAAGCDSLANASVATFDGLGFGGRNSVDCRFDPASRDGATFVGTQTCIDTYSREERAEPLTIRVDGPRAFTRTDAYGTASYAYCEGEALSDWGG